MDQTETDCAGQPPLATLSGGLRTRTLHLDGSRWAAALVRVHAGAHDAPQAYPGLAHFLEHLLFLGSCSYPVTQSLMPFVQRCGGQLNASTRERYTDYFFRLPAEELEAGLLRLIDMLARPLLDPGAQLREREVLHAEFLARAEDSETLCDAALGRAVDGAHPFSAFHAGNRDSLPVEDAQFQQALRAYHHRFYHAGQMELLLAGPQTTTALQLLAERATNALRAAPAIPRTAPRLIGACDSWMRMQLKGGAARLHVGYLLNDLPAGSAAALDYLAEQVGSQAPGSLSQRLRDAGWCDSIRLRAPYWYEGQGVAVIEVVLTDQGMQSRAEIVEAVRGWLRFFAEDACWAQCRGEYLRVRRRKLIGLEPLERLRYWIEPEAWSADSDESQIQQAFHTLMSAIVDARPTVLTAALRDCPPMASASFPLRLAKEGAPTSTDRQWCWELPRPNPLLRAELRPGPDTPVSPALCWVDVADACGSAALFLRWRFADGHPHPGLWSLLWRAMQTRSWAARQAGVEIRFERFGSTWCLSLLGFAQALPAVLDDLAALLTEPPVAMFGLEGQQRPARDDMLLRQLIDQLPLVLHDAQVDSDAPLDKAALEQAWRAALRDALALGHSTSLRGALGERLDLLPGAPLTAGTPQSSLPTTGGLRWHNAAPAGAETALLLFCPVPAGGANAEANWRLLARLMEAGFFRRLRSELQLGYAVFCGFRQVGERSGILFAMQSPTAGAAEILQHIEAFIAAFEYRLETWPALELKQLAGNLATQHFAAAGNWRAKAEQARDAWLAGQDAAYPQQVGIALRNISSDSLRAHLYILRESSAGWFALANAPAPDSRWTTVSTATFRRDGS